MSASPTLVVVSSSPACLAMAGHLFGIEGVELPSRDFSAWQHRYGHSPESTAARHALAARPWPAVIAVESAAAAEMLAPMARMWPDTRFLFLIEDPATALAADLPLPVGLTIAEWSVRREAAAQWIRRHLQRWPSRSLCLLQRELAGAPADAEILLRDRLGVALRVDPRPLPCAGPSELKQALASMLLAPEKELAASADELLASCRPLGETPTDGQAGIPDRGLVLSELASLTEGAAIGPGLQARIAELESRLDQLGRLLAEAEQARAEATARLARRDTELERVKVESEGQRRDLRLVQERLAEEIRGRQELAALLEARTAELGAARAQASQLNEDRTRLLEQLSAAATAPPGNSLSHRPAPTSPDALQRENDLLLVHLHQVQEELEHYVLENHSLAQGAGRGVGAIALSLGECQVERVRDARPHLELELCLYDVRLGDADAFEQLRLRLVEHNDRPGIVFAHDPGVDRQFLSSWLETGREGGVPHMLIVPSDTAGRACLQALPTSDWDALLALVHHLSEELAQAPATMDTGWPGVASRLARQLTELPPRLRYDRLLVSRDADKFEIRFEHVMFGARRLDELRLQWQPGAEQPLAVLAPAGAAGLPPLDQWPNDEDKRKPAVTVPVGKLGFLDKRRQWTRLSEVDRGLLLALLDALPAAADAGLAGGGFADEQAGRLRAEARRLFRDALAASGRREPLLGRVTKRLRARWRRPGASPLRSQEVMP